MTDFVSQPVMALAGLSRSGNKFSNGVFTELKQNGYRILPVNPQAETIQGERCYPSLSALPETVEAVLMMTPPAQTAAVVQQAVDAGIQRVWIQQGAESPEALELCKTAQSAGRQRRVHHDVRRARPVSTSSTSGSGELIGKAAQVRGR